MGQVMEWRRYEATALDARVLHELELSLGHARCREVLGDVAIEMIGKAARLERVLENGDQLMAVRLARMLEALARQVGLLEYARAAADLQGCLQGTDAVATAAVAARLARLGETSLHVLLELAHLPEL